MENKKQIYADDLIHALCEDVEIDGAHFARVKRHINAAPAVAAVSRGYHEQVRWERDIALEQLESYGISLGEKAYAVKLPHKPTPFLKDYNPHNTDAYCPECGTNLSGCYGGEPLPIVTCYVCGEIINPYVTMTKEELAKMDGGNEDV